MELQVYAAIFVLHQPNMLQNLKFWSELWRRWIMFRCGVYKTNVTYTFVTSWHYDQWNLQCVASTGSERLKWRVIIRSDELSCLHPLWHRVKWEEGVTATSVTLMSVVFWCCQHHTPFMLLRLSRLNSYWQLEASRKGELANIFLCHLVWSETDSVCSLSQTPNEGLLP